MNHALQNLVEETASRWETVVTSNERERGTAVQGEPWTFLLFRFSPLSPSTTGLLFGLLTLLVFGSLELMSGRPAGLLAGFTPAELGCEHLLGDYRIGLVGILLLAYTSAARFVLAQWTLEAASNLSSVLFYDAETLAERSYWGALPGVLGMLLCFAVGVDLSERRVEWTTEYWILPHIFNWAWCIPFGWIGGRFIYAVIADAVLVSRLARSVKVMDHSDYAPLEAATRHGLRSALLSLVFLGFVSVHFLDPSLGLPAMIFLVILFLLGALMSSLPAIGVIQVLYRKRDEQLELLQKEIEIEEQQLLTNDPDYEPGRINDLVALEKRLVDWNAEVFHFRTLFRLVLYTMLGFLSWLAAEFLSVVLEGMLGF